MLANHDNEKNVLILCLVEFISLKVTTMCDKDGYIVKKKGIAVSVFYG